MATGNFKVLKQLLGGDSSSWRCRRQDGVLLQVALESGTLKVYSQLCWETSGQLPLSGPQPPQLSDEVTAASTGLSGE